MMSGSYNSNASQGRRSSLNPNRRISSRGELLPLHQSRQSITRLTAKSFITNEDHENMFDSGHFSAKYVSKNSMSDSLRQQQSDEFAKVKTPEVADLDNSNPVMITGGFTEFPTTNAHEQEDYEAAVQEDSRSFTGGVSATPIGHPARRQSVLSSMISSSVMTPAPKLPDYLKNVNTRSIGSGEDINSNMDFTGSPRPLSNSEIDFDNPEKGVVKLVEKHLVSSEDRTSSSNNNVNSKTQDKRRRRTSPAGADFDSLKLQGGDMTRDLYNWVNEQKGSVNLSPIKRVNSSSSLSLHSRSRIIGDEHASESLDNDKGEILSVHEMMRPNGFRRSYIAKKHQDKQLDDIRNESEEPDLNQSLVHNHRHTSKSIKRKETKLTRPNFFTNNFIEFLTLYGHFAGEDLTEDNEQEQSNYSDDDESSYLSDSGSEYEEEVAILNDDSEIPLPLPPGVGTSQSPLGAVPLIGSSPSMNYFGVRRGRPSNISMGTSGNTQPAPTLQYQLLSGSKRMLKKRRKSPKQKTSTLFASKFEKSKKISSSKAFLLLLKAFIGTGIVFLPKAFSNGGLLFCNIMVVFFSVMSYYCFIVLINTTSRVGVTGYGDVGFRLFGPIAQFLILISLALSQLGFASSYVIFVAENLKEILNTIFKDKNFEIELFIFLQLLLFVPLSLTRNIGKLSFTALIADAFIFLGLIYIYFESSSHLVNFGVSEKIAMFKQDTWTLFIGTAVFSYEGIGLLIPIQESMATPEDFKKLLILVISIVTCVFITLSTISYLSFGDDVKTVILMNFPRGSAALTIQLCYAVAILLSTPLQLFPAIKIFENYLFHKDRTPWQNKIRRNSEARSLLSNNNDPWNPTNYESTVFNISGSPLKPLLSDESQALSEGMINQEGIMSGKQDSGIKWLKNIIRVGIVISMCLIGYFGSSNLDNFVSLVGSFTCVPLIYIYPPVLHLKCLGGEMNTGIKIINYTILMIGLCLMAYTSFQTISNW